METKVHRIPLEMDTPAPNPVPPGDTSTATPPAAPTGPIDPEAIRELAVAAIKTCYDPEIPVNIHELGLIYGLDVNSEGAVTVQMTLTSPACPVAGSLPGDVQAKLRAIPGVTAANVNLVWDPPWSPDRMSEAAKLQLGMF
jgi:FeS assembly SUF system protein